MVIILKVLAYILLAICLISMLCVYFAGYIRKHFHLQFKLNSRESQRLAALDAEKKEYYEKLILDLKLKRNLLLFAAATGAVSWIFFLILHYVYQI
ncbi:hypothetical protein PYS61_05255 [Amygdalobacter indicium]|jgi:hypothetical protein|uniref:DUF3899 domain-containing protein n=1 Tax=Amygdalobacter indicium TaxID=3029272 RepID=A0ABY8C4V8_9FIRM|nr:hypothetical protein [Amygdalobacter indicium]WEG33763.1 hypothetical protein PYS60_03425 [Amygdalobacter indicium]WEG35339.1 hypothetical protein PYS61_05255 [Amygdalobacter indicium]